jgi:hypothetical protein
MHGREDDHRGLPVQRGQIVVIGGSTEDELDVPPPPLDGEAFRLGS